LVVVLSDGKKIHIKARSEQHVGELMRYLAEIFPHAVRGYGFFQKEEVEARIGRRIRNYFWFEF
jgi:ArsR family metal-binding transcriptional regulator